MSALNRLLAQGKMEIVQASDGKKLKYIRKDEARTQLEAKMDSYEERLVYQQIEDSKSRGKKQSFGLSNQIKESLQLAEGSAKQGDSCVLHFSASFFPVWFSPT